MSKDLTPEDVARVLFTFGSEFLVDIRARHTAAGEYTIPYANLEYDLMQPDPDWINDIADRVNE